MDIWGAYTVRHVSPEVFVDADLVTQFLGLICQMIILFVVRWISPSSTPPRKLMVIIIR